MKHGAMYSLLKTGCEMTPSFYTANEIKRAVSMEWINQDECDELLEIINKSNDTDTTATVK